ncbi:MAG: hypothetical protein ACUVV0_00035 [Anaerolineae bacterium]
MSVNDSKTIAIECNSPIYVTPYVTSEPQDSEWGQPAASYYVFTIAGNRLLGQPIAGVYLPSPLSDIPPVEPLLALEFEAWDAASDEALANFEATLD